MSKKVIFTGIEILPADDGQSTKNLFGFVENIISRLESNLDGGDENFNMLIDTSFAPNQSTKYNISINGIKNRKTRDKVVKILQKSTEIKGKRVFGSLRVGLQIHDV